MTAVSAHVNYALSGALHSKGPSRSSAIAKYAPLVDVAFIKFAHQGIVNIPTGINIRARCIVIHSAPEIDNDPRYQYAILCRIHDYAKLWPDTWFIIPDSFSRILRKTVFGRDLARHCLQTPMQDVRAH